MDELNIRLAKEYGYWGEHPDHAVHEWQYEVSEDYTRLGYWEWIAERMKEGEE